jgi:hypothetical protein
MLQVAIVSHTNCRDANDHNIGQVDVCHRKYTNIGSGWAYDTSSD